MHHLCWQLENARLLDPGGKKIGRAGQLKSACMAETRLDGGRIPRLSIKSPMSNRQHLPF